jgi:hypothetical protein
MDSACEPSNALIEQLPVAISRLAQSMHGPKSIDQHLNTLWQFIANHLFSAASTCLFDQLFNNNSRLLWMSSAFVWHD